eukprot:1194030-Pleurochrysis_carterae.AAC.1
MHCIADIGQPLTGSAPESARLPRVPVLLGEPVAHPEFLWPREGSGRGDASQGRRRVEMQE